MAPFSQDVENADIAVIGMPFEKSAPMNASHKYGPKVLRELSKNFMGTTEPWINGEFDIPFDNDIAGVRSGDVISGASGIFTVRPFGFDVDFSDDREGDLIRTG